MQFAHHVPLQAEGRIECFRAFISQIFVRHPHTFLSHENAKTSCWLHLFNLILMWRFFLVCFHMSIYPNFDLNFVPHFSQSRDFFTLSGFSSCTCLLCRLTFDLCALSYGHFSHLCFLSRLLTAGILWLRLWLLSAIFPITSVPHSPQEYDVLSCCLVWWM